MSLKHSQVFVVFFSFFSSYAQQINTVYWQKGGMSALTFSQVSLTNWAGGGENSAALNANIRSFANYTKDRAKWENSVDLAYGLIKRGNSGFDKSDDHIDVVTKFGYQMSTGNSKWFFSGLLNFKTQFYKGFDPEKRHVLISDFMAPAYLIIGAGVDYYLNDHLSFSCVPMSGKFTFVTIRELADRGAYGVEAAVFDEQGKKIRNGKRFRAETGSFFRVKYVKGSFDSRLELFSNYKDKFSKIDVNWQNALVVSFSKVLSTNIFTHLIYDDDVKIEVDDNNDGVIDPKTEIRPRIQFKNVIGVGLTYTFGAKKE